MQTEDTELIMILRALIKQELAHCKESSTPKLCAILKSREGYRRAEEMIIRKALHDQTSVGAAIAQLETELL